MYGSKRSGNERDYISRMSSTLLHRGPDEQKVVLFDNLALGFCRLSIIGLENGMQPIYNEDESIVVICNGEIFNYIELRDQLKSEGHIFRTQSDVEVIVHLYEEFETEFLNQLNGQFAFVLYDKRRKILFCARDQMGIIPFFYTFVDNTFIFGSEIKAILEYPLVEKNVDMVGLDQIFTFSGLVSPRTMFKNINSLENGHFLIIDQDGRLIKKEYWDLIYPEEGARPHSKSEDYYIERLEDLFTTAIKFRLRSDVASGFYLSGGLDSSMIAMKAHSLAPTIRKEAFSIDFPDAQLSESVYQKIVASQCNSSLNQKVFFHDDVIARLRDSIYHSECPIKETYNTASMALSELVKKKGIKVILSGEGADELFAGYVGYRFDKIREMNIMRHHFGQAEENIRVKLWGDPSFFYEYDFTELNILKKNLYAEDLGPVFDEINCLNYPVINIHRINKRHRLDKRSYIDYKLRLVDHLVSDHGDRMALANSVEVRYPFLDKNLVEFSTLIPPELKLKDLTEKFILKRMASSFVPRLIIDREKFGFVAPGSPYLIKKNIEFINDTLSFDLIKKQGYFNPYQIEKLKIQYGQDNFNINAPFENDLLIVVLTFGILLDKFFK